MTLKEREQELLPRLIHKKAPQEREPHVQIMNGCEEGRLSDNDTLCNAALCSDNLACIMGECNECKSFPGLDFIASLKCSKECVMNGIDCNEKGHKVKCQQFRRLPYFYKGKTKKKMQLTDLWVTPSEMQDLLKRHMGVFPRHRYNVKHTDRVLKMLDETLDDNTIVKIQDFSENYTFLLPDEVYEIHWGQDECSLFPVVILRRVDREIREDHICFI